MLRTYIPHLWDGIVCINLFGPLNQLNGLAEVSLFIFSLVELSKDESGVVKRFIIIV